MQEVIREEFGIEFVIKASLEQGAMEVKFELYKIEGFDGDEEDGRGTNPLFEEKDGDPGSLTSDLDKAELFAHGSVKWDGCSNWIFDVQDQGYIHFCTQAEMVNVGLVMSICFDMTRDLLPNFVDWK